MIGRKIGFIGGGQMAEALLRGILAKVRPQSLRRFPLSRARGGLPTPSTTPIGIAPTPALLSPPLGVSSSELRSGLEEAVDIIPAGNSDLSQGWNPDSLHVFEPRADQLERLAGELGVQPCHSNIELAKRCDVLFLCVKPPAVPTVITELVKAAALTPNHLIISIAAGCTLETFESKTPSRCIRVMPNTPCLVQAGASAFTRGKTATEEDVQVVREIFGAVGILHEVPEHLMAAVTGLSGSGPAYVYEFIEALADGGVREGLPRELAMELAAATVRGAADMVLRTRKHPGELKDAVASPAGTTIEGIFVLEENGFRSTAMKAVSASARRARELS